MQKSKVKFYEYQKLAYYDLSRFMVLMWARQTGKNFTCGSIIATDMYKAEMCGKKSDWLIVSYTERQAKEALKRVAEVIKLIQKTICEIKETDNIAGELKFKAFEITLPRGSTVTALSSNPDSLRGYSRNVFLDEFAMHADSDEIWAAALPIISAGYRLIVASTPKGKNNKFHELITDKSEIWSKHVVDIYEAVSQGLDRDVEMLKKAYGRGDKWAQEYELQFVDAESQYFTGDLLTRCVHKDAGKPQNYRGGRCYIGVDIAKEQDMFSVVVLEKCGGTYWVRDIFAQSKVSFSEQQHILQNYKNNYKVARISMDKTGVGGYPVEEARRRLGNIVEGVNFTIDSKLLMADRLKDMLEQEIIRIPNGSLINELKQIEKEVLPGGGIRLKSPRINGSHGDIAWGLMLSCYGTIGGGGKISYESIDIAKGKHGRIY